MSSDCSAPVLHKIQSKFVVKYKAADWLLCRSGMMWTFMCSAVVDAPSGKVTLGAYMANGIEQKGVESLQQCLKKCASAGLGIPPTVCMISYYVKCLDSAIVVYRVAQNKLQNICLMLNWYSVVKSQPNFIIFGRGEDILNIACKLISTILCDWHCLVACQHNSWANFILRQHRKRTILFLQGSVETRNRCCGQYMHCFVWNLFRCKSAKNYKIRLRFHKVISI